MDQPDAKVTRDRMDKRFLDAAYAAHEHMQQEFGLPPKPAFRAICNNCGLCCMASLCEAARQLNPRAEAPCEHIVLEDGKALCGLVIAEREKGMIPVVQTLLGIGTGCSMGDATTTSEELDAWDNEILRLFRPKVQEIMAEVDRERAARKQRL